VLTRGLNDRQKVQGSTTQVCQRAHAKPPIFVLSSVGTTPTSGDFVIRRLFSSQLRINMLSGMVTTFINTLVMVL
jgi:hypothetical protein